MSNFKPYKPKSESELHSLIQKDFANLEEGMNLIQHEINLPGNIPDFLCVDSGSRLTIIEVKLGEDRDILFQGLRYYNVVEDLKWQIAALNKDDKIDPSQNPRIILIASNFSDETRRMCMLVKPMVDLYEYNSVVYSKDKIGVTFKSVSIPVEQSLPEYKTIEEFKDYIKKDELRPIFDKSRQDIKEISAEIEEYCTTQYIGYKYKKKQIAWIRTKRNEFEVVAHELENKINILDYPKIVFKEPTFNVDEYNEVLDTIGNSISILNQ